jgi:putative tryptophan/tyrosine transport system substrate-binding protein
MSAIGPKRTSGTAPRSGVSMRRREFLVLLAGAASWPFGARAQQKVLPIIGLLGSTSADESSRALDALRAGLRESGFTEGQNVAIEYRWAHGRYRRLPALATDLVNIGTKVIITTGSEPSALAAKAATSKTPIVFVVDGDPVNIGLVDSLNNPGANVTGMSLISPALEAKRLGLLRELVPKSTLMAVLANEDYPDTDRQLAGVETAAEEIGQKISIQNVRSERDLDSAFTTMSQLNVDALLVAADPLFTELNDQIVALASRYKIPAIYASREFVTVGGIMSYGASATDAYRGAGLYAGKILKGAKPAALPVQLPTKFDLVINLKAAKMAGVTIPPSLLARADEVIE